MNFTRLKKILGNPVVFGVLTLTIGIGATSLIISLYFSHHETEYQQQSESSANAEQPALIENMAQDVKRDLDERHTARQSGSGQSGSNEEAQPVLIENMAEDIKRSLDERHQARQE